MVPSITVGGTMAEDSTEIPLTQFLYRIMESAQLSREHERHGEGVDVLWAVWGKGPEDDPSLHARVVRGRDRDPLAPGPWVHSVERALDEQGAFDLHENHGDDLETEADGYAFVQDVSVPTRWRHSLEQTATKEAKERGEVA